MLSYEETFQVPQVSCDLMSRLNLGSILRLAEQIGTDQCIAESVSPAYMRQYCCAFVLAKCSVEIRRDVHAGETLRGITDAGGCFHGIFPRTTSFFGQDGECSISLDTRWVLADTTTRAMLHRPPDGMRMPFEGMTPGKHDLRIPRPELLEPAGTVSAVYSRIDPNGHLNNSYYGDILCDALPLELFKGPHGFTKAVLSYRSELPAGHSMVLRCGQIDDAKEKVRWYVCGQAEQTTSFEGILCF